MAPWFAPDWRERYAAHFRRYLALYAIAKAAGRKLTCS